MAAPTMFYTKRSWVSQVRSIMDTDMGDEERTGVVHTGTWFFFFFW